MIQVQELVDQFKAAADTLAVPEALESATGVSVELQARLIRSVLIVIILLALRWIALRTVRHNIEDVRSRYTWRKTVTYILVALGILLIGRVWFAGFRDLSTILGLFAAGLAFALREPISNMAGWAFILWRRPFAVGDRIEIGQHAGDVIDLRLFQFTLLEIRNWVDADQSTGRIIHVPNGEVFTTPLANFTQGFSYIWHEIPVLITFESDWKKAKSILQRIAKEHGESLSAEAKQRVLEASRRYMIFYTTLSPTVYTKVVDSGVLLTIRYLSDPRNRRGSTEVIWESILDEFARHDDIDFAYPTWRILNDILESSPHRHPSVGGSAIGSEGGSP